MRKRHFLTAFFLCSIIGLVGYKVYKKNMEPSSEVSKPVNLVILCLNLKSRRQPKKKKPMN